LHLKLEPKVPHLGEADRETRPFAICVG